MRRVSIGILGAVLWCHAAAAQSTAQPVLPGSLQTSGCAPGYTSCYVPYSATNPVPVTQASSAAATTTSSSTVTTGGTFQQLAAANTARLSLDFENKSGNGDICYLYLGTTGAATTALAVQVKDGQEYLRSSGAVPSDAVQATCATTGDKYYFAIQ